MGKYSQLSLKERNEIFKLEKIGMGRRAIARSIGRHPTTIGRELSRNSLEIGYLPDSAQKKSQDQRTHRKKKIESNEKLQDYVIAKLRFGWSPEQIAGVMKKDKMENRVSHETIYKFIYTPTGKYHSLYLCLRYRSEKRNQMHGRKHRSQIIRDRVSIHLRPEYINNRSSVGHFEGDLTFFSGSQSANLGILTDRKSLFTVLIKNTSKKSDEVIGKMAQRTSLLQVKSVTFDNGSEFVQHKRLNVDTYFCDPGSPQQKGTVENTISRLHRFIHKNCNINEWTDEEIQKVALRLNLIPRKKLGYETPYSVFFSENQGVALQT